MILQRFRKGQSVTEYAILLGLAIAAFAGMQLYIKRGLQGKLKDASTLVTQNASGSFSAIDGVGTPVTLNLARTQQYEPYYTESATDSVSSSNTQDTVTAGAARATTSTEASASAGYRAERTGNTSTYNGTWQ
jgi:hypothetical protein